MYRYFKKLASVGNGNYIYFWKSRGLSDENITTPIKPDYCLNQNLSYFGTKIRVKLNRSCLNQGKITYNHKKIVKIYIVYKINKNYNMNSYPKLENSLFAAVSLTKNDDIEKYKYSGYGIGFDKKGFFSVGNGVGRNVIIFGVDMSSSSHIDKRKKVILILGKSPTQVLEHTLTAEKMYSINFTKNNKNICLSLHYNRANSYLFVNGTEIITFKSKDSEIVATPLCAGNISKDISVDNMKKTGLNRYFYTFSADCDAIAVADILDIHKYLMKKNGIV